MSEQTRNPMKLEGSGPESAVAAPPAHDRDESGTAGRPPAEETASAGAAGPSAPEPSGTDAPPSGTPSEAEMEERIVRALKTVYDPEIPVDIYELGLIYDIAFGPADGEGERAVDVKMTLTSPACPVAGSLPGEVEQKVASVEGVERAEVEIVWDPPWNPGMMSEAAKLELGMF